MLRHDEQDSVLRDRHDELWMGVGVGKRGADRDGNDGAVEI